MPVLLTASTLGIISNTTSPPIDGDSSNQRNVWDIVWSCLMTIFACTWIAVHPNIPAISDTGVMVALRRAGLMMCGLIAPEIIILWAMRQWNAAREIGQRHKEQGWTTTHGFFLQMGGFMLHSEGKAIRPLKLEELESLHCRGYIEWPKITESEIQDRSKGDALSKGIVTLQTSWFLIQCIVRGSTGLVITELELLTLAFASLNIVTYFFWWNKPVDVRHPHPVHPNSSTSAQYIPTPQRISTPRSHATHIKIRWVARFLSLTAPAMRGLTHVIHGIMGRTSESGRVSTFYAAEMLSPDPVTFFSMTIACSALGSVFGGIHCIAWSYQFPSHKELILWRTASMVITCGPIFIMLLSISLQLSRITFNNPTLGPRSSRWWSRVIIMAIQYTMLILSVVVYIAARLVLIMQACITLRKLSPGALQAMEWTSFIPHF